jgi:hypothetical protein
MKILPNEETKKPFKPFAILIETAEEALDFKSIISVSCSFSEDESQKFNDACIRAQKGE